VNEFPDYYLRPEDEEQEERDKAAEMRARFDRARDADRLASEIRMHGCVITDEGFQAAGRLTGWLIEDLGLTPDWTTTEVPREIDHEGGRTVNDPGPYSRALQAEGVSEEEADQRAARVIEHASADADHQLEVFARASGMTRDQYVKYLEDTDIAE
jgi:hypothetical protein